jgi:hypothetical protein
LHPKKICDDFAQMGSPLVLEGNDLFIENPEKVYPALQELAKSYKSRIITYLKGGYSEKDHSVKQTIDKIVDYFRGIELETNTKIDAWLRQDDESIKMIMRLMETFWNNGWRDFTDPVANFENEETDKLSNEIFSKAMSYFKGA